MMPISRQKRIIVYQKRIPRGAASLETRVSKTAVSSVGPRSFSLSLLLPSSSIHPLHYYPLGKHPGSIRGHSTHGLNASQDRVSEEGRVQFTRKRTRMCFILIIFRKKETAFLPPLCLTGYSIHNNVAGELQPCVAWRWSQVKYEKILGEKLRSSGFFLSLLTRQRFLKACSYLF